MKVQSSAALITNNTRFKHINHAQLTLTFLNEVGHDMENYQASSLLLSTLSRRLKLMMQTEDLIILHIMQKPSSIIVLLFI